MWGSVVALAVEMKTKKTAWQNHWIKNFFYDDIYTKKNCIILSFQSHLKIPTAVLMRGD